MLFPTRRHGENVPVAVNHKDDKDDKDCYEPPWIINILLNGAEVKFKIDSGADVNVMSHKQYLTLDPAPELKQSKTQLDGKIHPKQQKQIY